MLGLSYFAGYEKKMDELQAFAELEEIIQSLNKVCWNKET